MNYANHGRIVGGSRRGMTDQKPGATRREPRAAYAIERVGADSPLLYPVLAELNRLKKYGVEITNELIDKVAANHEEAERRKLAGTVVVPKQASPIRKRPTSMTVRYANLQLNIQVVYYARIGDRVKIGTSASLLNRMQSINPEEIMVLEAGGFDVEARRHQQFKALRTHGEWFKLEGALVDHIEQLRAQAQSVGQTCADLR